MDRVIAGPDARIARSPAGEGAAGNLAVLRSVAINIRLREWLFCVSPPNLLPFSGNRGANTYRPIPGLDRGCCRRLT